MADRKSDENNEEKPRIPEEQRLPRPGPTTPTDADRQQQQRQLGSSQWIPPTTGNPDLDPAGQNQSRLIDLRERNQHIPQGMIYDPRQLLDQQRFQHPSPGMGFLPPGARFDPFGPPDPSQVGPGRGPRPSSQFGVPDPDHLPPPGYQPPNPNFRRGDGRQG